MGKVKLVKKEVIGELVSYYGFFIVIFGYIVG